MLNIFYWYGSIWSIVFILYELGWSNYCTPLNGLTIVLFLSSIAVSFILGTIFRGWFNYNAYKDYLLINRNHSVTILIWIMAIADFVYSRDVPLISILARKTQYTDFAGLPIVHTLLENLIIFYSAYLFYLFLESKNKGLLIETLSILSILLLLFHKGALTFCIFSIVNLGVAKVKSVYGKLKPKTIVIIILLVFFVLYANGGLTNLRSGVSWNNSAFPIAIGKINAKWPKWLPIQFSWAYTYIITPLGNLNLNITKFVPKKSVFGLILTIVPDYIVKRIFPGYQIKKGSALLYTPILNACTGFIESVENYGIGGMWYFFFAITIIMIILISIRGNERYQFRSVYFSLLSMMMVVLFFYNTFSTAATSFLPLFILLEPYLSRVRFVFKGKDLP